MIYKVPLVFQPQPEGGFTVTSPILPELVTEGDTIQEALANVEDALAAVVEIYHDLGRSLPATAQVADATGPVWAETLVTTETKAKALRPVMEKCITAAKKGGVARQRRVVALIRDKDMAHKLFAEIGPRYADRNGGYTRILKLGPRQGDSAPMARIELV